ncbi:YceI family protein [Mangrovibacterium lignilyticum]|uniref:YceI family protein n=1 Tax=Mangrovibacterium lignilyticum TaxID=2668052 RepID=UPI0013D01E4B|nr:YceI family protein [Mangrovibacterium lignilyticum]
MKLLLLFCLAFLSSGVAPAQILKSTDVKLSFFSEAPIEDIYAVSNQGLSALNLQSGVVYFNVSIRSFEFEKKLMQEHFNENYLESEKFPYAEFKGKFGENIDPDFSGSQAVTVRGELTIHGVTKSYLVKGKINSADGKLVATADFPVALADHRVKIPRILIKNIAEVVKVTVSATYDTTAGVAGESTASP